MTTGSLEFQFPPDPEHLRSLRKHLRDKLDEIGVRGENTDDVLLVIDEIVTNSIEHSHPYRNDDGQLLIRLGTSGRDVVLEFEDPDVPEDVIEELAVAAACADDCPPPDSERGRGLFLIALNIDRLVISRRAAGGMHLRGRFRDALA